MKYLFLSILMIGVGIGVVGCEDDDKDPPEEEVEEEVQTRQQPQKWEPDVSGLWELSAVDYFTNGVSGGWVDDIRIRQSGESIAVEYIDFLNPTSPPRGVDNGYVTKEYTVFWGDYSGVINEGASCMRGTNISIWGTTSVWGAVKLPDNWMETLNAKQKGGQR